MSRDVLTSMAALAFVVLIAGATSVSAQSWEAVPHPDTSLGEQFFHVEYGAEPRGTGQSEISGYVYNDYGQAADNVELDIIELDQSGQPIGNVTGNVVGVVPAEGRAYFHARVPQSASYRINVRGFDFIESGSGAS